MDFILSILTALGLIQTKDLADSMQRSKTLTVMVIVALILCSGSVLFLFHMASN